MEPESINQIPVEILGMSLRTTNALIYNDVETVGEILELGIDDLSNLRGMGQKGIDEVQTTLLRLQEDQEFRDDIIKRTSLLGLGSVDEPERTFDNVSVEDIGLSPRATNALLNNHLITVGDVVRFGEHNLSNLRGMGSRCLDEIKAIFPQLLSGELFSPDQLENYTFRRGGYSHLGDKLSDQVKDLGLQGLCLSPRVINALAKRNILTVRQLINTPYSDLKYIRGLGSTGLRDIEAALDRIVNGGCYTSLHEWIQNACHDERHLAVVELFYGLKNGIQVSANELAENYEISNTRIWQMVDKFRKKLQAAINGKVLDPAIFADLKAAANRNTPLQDIRRLDDYYDKDAIIALYANVTKEFEIYTDSRLQSTWLTEDGKQFKALITNVIRWLSAQLYYVPLDKIVEQTNTHTDLILDLKGILVDDDYVALDEHYKKGNLFDLTQHIVNIMDEQVRPMKVSELVEATGINESRIRRLVLEIPGVVNVGRSTYALEKYGYSGKDVKELAIEYLEQAGEPATIREITKYVLNRKQVEEKSVVTTVTVMPEIFTVLDGGFIALAEWGYDPKIKNFTRYDVPTREAVLSIVDNEQLLSNRDILEKVQATYGDSATDSIVSIGATTKSLYNNGTLDELEIGKTKYYRLAQP